MPKTVGQQLQVAREKANLSQAELAEAVGLAPNHVARLERGEKAFPRFDTIARLAGELGLSLDTIAAECGISGFSKGAGRGQSLRKTLKSVQIAADSLAEAHRELSGTVTEDLRRAIASSRFDRSD